jgi:hypothetical protein
MVTLEQVRKDAPWSWIKGAIDDMVAAPVVSLAYGLAFTIVGLAITVGLWALGQGGLDPGSGGRVRPDRAGLGHWHLPDQPDARCGRDARPHGFLDDFRLAPDPAGAAERAASGVLPDLGAAGADDVRHGDPRLGFPAQRVLPFLFTDPAGVALLVIGTAVGAALALAAFTVSALSFPMMVDQDVDAITAVVASIKAVKDQPMVMLTWAWIIAFCTAAGLAVFLVGIAITFPLIAHASWRAYKDFNPRPTPSAKEVEAQLAEKNHA